jgi:hypothetical protein
MTRFSSILLVTAALVAGLGTTAPAFAADRGSAGYHWEFTPGPRGTAHRVADRPAKPVEMAASRGHWRWNFGPRGSATWVPASNDRRTMAVERMAEAKATTEANTGAL